MYFLEAESDYKKFLDGQKKDSDCQVNCTSETGFYFSILGKFSSKDGKYFVYGDKDNSFNIAESDIKSGKVSGKNKVEILSKEDNKIYFNFE